MEAHTIIIRIIMILVIGLAVFAALDIGAYDNCLSLVDAGVRSAYYCEYSVK